MQALDKQQVVSVIGAGTMGAGIAQVAATAGHPVFLYDRLEGAGEQAKQNMMAQLDKLVLRNKFTKQQVSDIGERINVVDDIAQLADSALVIEAIVEDLAIKQSLFAQLEELCSKETILASNTSSLSVSAMAAKLQHPERLVGMHFFNPAPILKLVEVVHGLHTSEVVIDTIFNTAQNWGKTAVRVKSSPGFIVNRVARPYYAEAMRSLNECVANVATIDAVIRGSGGFKLGPFELTDLIGQDINYAVTQSVYAAYYQDKRFQPSLLQREFVEAGRLGRKTGHGFYQYSDGKVQQTSENTVEIQEAGQYAAPKKITAYGDLSVAQDLLAMAAQADIEVVTKSGSTERAYIEIDSVHLQLSDGHLASQCAQHNNHADTILFDLALNYNSATHIALAPAGQASADALHKAIGFFQALDKHVCVIKDVPGMLVMRTVTMLVNEAADAVNQGVCSAEDADKAMQLGVAYPAGPLAWGQQIGLSQVVSVINNMFSVYNDSRYRCSPLLLNASITKINIV